MNDVNDSEFSFEDRAADAREHLPRLLDEILNSCTPRQRLCDALADAAIASDWSEIERLTRLLARGDLASVEVAIDCREHAEILLIRESFRREGDC